ncbi:MAG: ABC transporter ATP-binding protein [Geodermatophilaceae bacterium]|nr:ABC transporter ATP-binding protein [Geodermatophilaceae bacterium]
MTVRDASPPVPVLSLVDSPPTATGLVVDIGRRAGAWAVVLLVTAVVLAVAELALPALLGRTVDDLLTRSVGVSVVLLAAVVAVVVIGAAVEDLAVAQSTARSTAQLRTETLRHVLAVGAPAVELFPPGDLTARVVGNTAEAGSVAADAIRAAVTVLPAVGGVVALFVIDLWLGVTFLVGAPLLLFVLWLFAREAADLSADYLAAQGVIADRLGQARAGARTIAAAGTAEQEIDRILAPLPALGRSGLGMWRAQSRITVQDMLIFAGLEIAVLAVAGWQLAAGRLSPGELVAASQYVALAANLSAIAPALSRLIRARAAAARLVDVLSLNPTGYGACPPGPAAGRLEFRGVTVRRGTTTVLDRVDLLVAPGSVLAIVGRSGSGKSVLAALAARLVDPDEGQVVLDWVPLTQWGHDDLRRAVGYAFARPTLFGASVGAALAFGIEDPTGSDLRTAARAARADPFIRRFPEGYDTALASAPMSGGELQRMGLARAFAHPGRVLVLDDVAASLDTVTDHEISAALLTMTDRTRILVAHRASTAARADRVLWLEHGRIRALDRHERLWSDPEYRALFEVAPVAGTGAP